MKKHQLIFMCTALFIVLFYQQDMGINFGILGSSFAVLTYFYTRKINRNRTFLIIFALTILSAISWMWYADFPSFLSLIISILILTLKSKNRNMKPLFVIPVFVTNGFTFICRVFSFDKWLPKINTGKVFPKLLALVFFPLICLSIFFGIYALGSENFAELFENYELDFDVWQFIILACLGFFLAFNYWHFAVERYLYKNHHFLNDSFRKEQKVVKPTYSFLGIELERTGGVITFMLLNLLLLFFIATYNYEQFYASSKLPHRLSEDTHERVYAVIISIVMAVFVIMFYFKSSFNFDPESRLLKISAQVWLLLNGVLVVSALAKNTEYVLELGITYKRIGVFAFLILCMAGLFYTHLKIKNQRTNAYLINRMFWYFYGMILASSFVNWGNLATIYNIENGKGDFYFLNSLRYNHKTLMDKFPEEANNSELKEYIKSEQEKSFLSKTLYWQTIDINKFK